MNYYRQILSLILSIAMATPATWAATPPSDRSRDLEPLQASDQHKRRYQVAQDAEGNPVIHIFDMIRVDDEQDLNYAKSQARELIGDQENVNFALRLVPDTVEGLTISVIPQTYPEIEVETLELPVGRIATELKARAIKDKIGQGFSKAWNGVRNWYNKTLDKAGVDPDKFDTKMAIYRGVGVGGVFFAGLVQVDGMGWLESFTAASAAFIVNFAVGALTAGGISLGIQKRMTDYTNWIPRPGFIATIISRAVSANLYLNGVPGGVAAHADTIKDNFLDRSFWSLQLTNESTKFYITEFIVLALVAASMAAASMAGFGQPLFENFEEWLWVTSEYSARVLVSQGLLDIAFSKHKAMAKLESMKLSVEEGLWDKSFYELNEQEQLKLIDKIISKKIEAPKELVKRLRRIETDFAFKIFLVALGTNFGAAAGLTGNDLGKMVLNSFAVGGAGYLAYVSAHNGPAMSKIRETLKDLKQGNVKKACDDLFTAVGRMYK